jgi:hypothetical protein
VLKLCADLLLALLFIGMLRLGPDCVAAKARPWAPHREKPYSKATRDGPTMALMCAAMPPPVWLQEVAIIDVRKEINFCKKVCAGEDQKGRCRYSSSATGGAKTAASACVGFDRLP